jgi:2-keto-4-pentenoate hydratase/2-oxohepta-3-ene-1,7-dioic acid hydratase in catechol pathway
MILDQSDVIATGTPPGVGPLKKGDAVEVEIEGIGVFEETLWCSKLIPVFRPA